MPNQENPKDPHSRPQLEMAAYLNKKPTEAKAAYNFTCPLETQESSRQQMAWAGLEPPLPISLDIEDSVSA